MKLFKRPKPVKVTTEKCVTEAEFNNAVNELLTAYSKVIGNAESMTDKDAVKKAIVSRISALEQLQHILFEGR